MAESVNQNALKLLRVMGTWLHKCNVGDLTSIEYVSPQKSNSRDKETLEKGWTLFILKVYKMARSIRFKELKWII